MEAGFGVVVLAGETEWGVGAAVAGPGGGAPERGPGSPGNVTGLVDEFAGGADEVGGDGEEAAVDLLLARVGRQDALGLGQGDVEAVVPGEGDRVREVRLVAGLFAQGQAVPGEPDLLDHGLAVGCQALLGGAAAERVVAVRPLRSVGGGDGGETVLGVPRVVPGVGFAGEPGLLAQDDPAEGVVLEPDATGAGEGGAAVCAGPGGFAPGVAGRPGSRGLVAGVVVGIALRPALGVDGGDPAGPVEVEGAGARQPVRDGCEVPVGPVGVGAAVDRVTSGGDVLLAKPSGFVPRGGHGDRIAEDA